jgi:hypothetical protein
MSELGGKGLLKTIPALNKNEKINVPKRIKMILFFVLYHHQTEQEYSIKIN